MKYIYNTTIKMLISYEDDNDYVLQENDYLITQEQFNAIVENKNSTLHWAKGNDNKLSFTFTKNVERELKDKQNQLRNRRKNLLNAFDKWEKAVMRGREVDSEEIMSWYKNILDLKESAFNNIPDRIKYYL